MKMKHIITLTVAGVLFSSTAFADKPLNLQDVPAAVRQTLSQQNAEVKQIKRETRDGKTVYQIKIKQKGPEKEIYIAEDGTIVSDAGKGKSHGKGKPGHEGSPGNSSLPTSHNSAPVAPTSAPTVIPQTESAAPKAPVTSATVTQPAAASPTLLRDLPAPAQRTIKKAIGDDGKVRDIDKQVIDGKTSYRVEYTDGDHRYEMTVGEDGTKTDRVRSKSIPVHDLPAAVRATIKKEVGAGEIKDVDKSDVKGKTVYQIAFNKGGIRHEVQIAEDGALLK